MKFHTYDLVSVVTNDADIVPRTDYGVEMDQLEPNRIENMTRTGFGQNIQIYGREKIACGRERLLDGRENLTLGRDNVGPKQNSPNSTYGPNGESHSPSTMWPRHKPSHPILVGYPRAQNIRDPTRTTRIHPESKTLQKSLSESIYGNLSICPFGANLPQ